MKVIIITTNFGFIALNEDYEIASSKLLLDDGASLIEAIDKCILTSYEVEFIDELSSRYDDILIETNKPLNVYESLDCFENIRVEKGSSYGKHVRDNLYNIIGDISSLSNEKLLEIAHNQYMEASKNKITESVKTNDVMIVETINALEDLEDSTGRLIERLRQWCMPYLPELDKLHNHQLYTRLIAFETTRENIRNSPLLKGTDVTLSDEYDIQMNDNDLEIIKSFALSLNALYESKNTLEEYIQEKVHDVAPNLYDVAGANLAAKLIAHCNGLENLAKLPSSTVQIIGAEKAVFRHLKTGEKPPKHGLIFQHPAIRGSNWWHRGKLARAVAGKITIAARRDAFTGEYSPGLREQLEKRVEKIKKDNPFPERKNKKSDTGKKKDGKSKKDKRKKPKRNKRKLKKGEYIY
ncbi:MAG: ATP-binding protein [Methanosphaera sp.]|nr:ATP-binding protein [Methanosphaera sp.]